MNSNVTFQGETKFCKECGQRVAKKAVICPRCGCQIEEMHSVNAPIPQIVITNNNQNMNQNTNQNTNPNMNNNVGGRTPYAYGAALKSKWVALFLCLFFGCMGAHKFYEGKVGLGILYAFTGGLFFFGWFFNTLSLLGKPNHYYAY